MDNTEEKEIEVVEVQEQKEKEVQTEEKEEAKIEIDYSSFGNLGTAEEIEQHLKGTLGDNPTQQEINIALKMLEKMNASAKEEEESELQERIQANKEAVLKSLPIPEKDFRTLNSWVLQQSPEYIKKIEEETNFQNKTPEEIKEAISRAHQDRLRSAGGAVKIDSATATNKLQSFTKEEVMKNYSEIYKNFKGQERIKKINELKEESIANSKIGEWATAFFK